MLYKQTGIEVPETGLTMIGRERLHHLRGCVEMILRENINGDFVEAGVWRGGACLLMREVLRAYGVTDRAVYVADSFRGLPVGSSIYPADLSDRHHTFTSLRVSRAEVERNFQLPDEQVVFVEGWFRDTMPALFRSHDGPFALLRLDGDMYESTWEVLANLYDMVATNGIVIVDDWHLPNCQKAVWDFLKARPRPLIMLIDEYAAWWRKPE